MWRVPSGAENGVSPRPVGVGGCCGAVDQAAGPAEAGRAAAGSAVDQPEYGPTLVLSLAIAAKSLSLTPASAAPECSPADFTSLVSARP